MEAHGWESSCSSVGFCFYSHCCCRPFKELTSYYFPADPTPEYLRQLKHQTFRLGLAREAGWPNDWRANGVFFNRYVDGRMNVVGAPLVEMTQTYIHDHDGTSLTLLMSERLDAGSYAAPPVSAGEAEAALGFVWWPPSSGGPPLRSQRINGPRDVVLIHNARPSNNHPGGVVVHFCDGHCRFLSEDIDYSIYCKLMTPCDSDCNDPAAIELVPADATNGYQFLREAALMRVESSENGRPTEYAPPKHRESALADFLCLPPALAGGRQRRSMSREPALAGLVTSALALVRRGPLSAARAKAAVEAG